MFLFSKNHHGIRNYLLILALLVSVFSFSASFTTAAATTTHAQTTYTYYLPFLANSYVMSGTTGSYTTYLAIQNTGSATANINIQYYQANNGSSNGGTGILVSPPPATCTTIAAHAECTAPNPFSHGVKGTGIISSDQPLKVIVPEATPYGGTAYTATDQQGQWFLPFVSNDAFGGFTSQFVLFNSGSDPIQVYISIIAQNGYLYQPDRIYIPGYSSYTFDLANTAALNLPTGSYGWASISAKDAFGGALLPNLVVQLLQRNTDTHFLTLTNAKLITIPFTPQNNSTIYIPTVFNQAFGSYKTGLSIMNETNSPITVTVTYYDNIGTVINTAPFVFPSSSKIVTIYHGDTSGDGLPIGGLPVGFYGSATITTQGGSIDVLVNQIGGLTAGGMGQTGTYIAPSKGSSSVYLPVMDNGGFGFTTGATILNTSNQPVTATVQYYNLDGSPVGHLQTYNIAGNASQAVYQGDPSQGLAVGFKGTALVTETSGAANSLIVTTNAQSNDFFYTYTSAQQE